MQECKRTRMQGQTDAMTDARDTGMQGIWKHEHVEMEIRGYKGQKTHERRTTMVWRCKDKEHKDAHM